MAAKAYRVGTGWAVRPQIGGERLYLDGFETKTAAEKEAIRLSQEFRRVGRPKHEGPHKTTLAVALQLYGLERLPFLKGATQEVKRINKFLRAAGNRQLQVTAVTEPEQGQPVDTSPKGSPPPGALFKVELKSIRAEQVIPKSLRQHRQELATKTHTSDKCRARLAGTNVADVVRHQVQDFVNALRTDGLSPSTIALERSVLRTLFNHAATVWGWAAPAENPATGLKMPKIDNGRDRVMSEAEQERLEAALADCHNRQVAPMLVLLRETAMRSSEPLEQARWADVDWERNILHLSDAKAGKRDVPLSPDAVQALRELQAMHPKVHPQARIARISYEALKAAWRRVCEKAGVEGLRMHDLRHTAATRLALLSGNPMLVKALTGHKTSSQLERYVNIKAEDVVRLLHANAAVAAKEVPPPRRITPVIDAIEGNVVRLQLAQGRAA
jgi:integrase